MTTMLPHETLAQPLALPNGTSLPNRIGKAAMSEQLGTRANAPTPGLARAYASIRTLRFACSLSVVSSSSTSSSSPTTRAGGIGRSR